MWIDEFFANSPGYALLPNQRGRHRLQSRSRSEEAPRESAAGQEAAGTVGQETDGRRTVRRGTDAQVAKNPKGPRR